LFDEQNIFPNFLDSPEFRKEQNSPSISSAATPLATVLKYKLRMGRHSFCIVLIKVTSCL